MIDLWTNMIADYVIKELDQLEWEETYWKAFIDDVADPWENKLKLWAMNTFQDMKIEILDNMKRHSLPIRSVKQSTEDWIADWLMDGVAWRQQFRKGIFERQHGIVADVGQRTMESLPVVDVAFNVENPLAAEMLKKRSIKFSASVVDTTEAELRAILAEGIEAGEGMPALKKRIAQYFEFDRIPKRAEMIARTETIWGANEGTEQAYIQSGQVQAKEWLIAGGERTCEMCLEMYRLYGPGTGGISLGGIFAKEGSEVAGVAVTYEDIAHPPLHPRCLIDSRIPIYTSKGWMPIGKIKEDDLVLTHKGRFRKVLATIKTSGQIPEVMRIDLEEKGHQRSSLTLTANHPILCNGQWMSVEGIKVGDNIDFLAKKCRRCEKLIPCYNQYCSHSCLSKDITDKQWANPEHRENVSRKAKAQLKQEFANGTRDRFEITKKANKKTRQLAKLGLLAIQREDIREKGQESYRNNFERCKASSERMKRNNPSCIPEVRARMTKSYLKTMKDHPEKHPNVIMAQKGFISSLERKFKDILDKIGISYIQQYPILQYFVDFAIPELRIVFEIDGKYWHRDKEKDLKRQKEIEAEGWFILRYSEKKINGCLNEIEGEVRRVFANHKGEYEFLPMEVKKIKKRRVERPRTLYNLSVEEDESYIAKGFTVHNCRCVLLPVIISR